jgi:hypothetical protein
VAAACARTREREGALHAQMCDANVFALRCVNETKQRTVEEVRVHNRVAALVLLRQGKMDEPQFVAAAVLGRRPAPFVRAVGSVRMLHVHSTHATVRCARGARGAHGRGYLATLQRRLPSARKQQHTRMCRLPFAPLISERASASTACVRAAAPDRVQRGARKQQQRTATAAGLPLSRRSART